jgi:hypothetical protein
MNDCDCESMCPFEDRRAYNTTDPTALKISSSTHEFLKYHHSPTRYGYNSNGIHKPRDR